jgi:subtilisin family serine protease
MAVSDNSQPGGSTNYVAGQLIIQFDPDLTPPGIQQILAGVGAQIADTLNPGGNGVGPLALAQLPPGLDPAVIAKALSHIPGVTFAEPNYVLSIQATSTDPAYTGGQLWGMEGDTTTPANAYGSQAGEAWASGYTGSTKVAVGVVDTGIDYKHPDLYKNVWLNQNEIPAAIKAALQDVDSDGLITFRDLNNAANAASVTDVNANGRIDAGDLLNDVRWENGADEDANGYKDDLIGWDFVNNDNDPYDDNSHGTHVSGTIGATANDGGAVGVNWNTQIVALKFLDASGSGSSANAIKALDYLTNASKAGGGIDYAASNNSWGGDAFSQAMLDAIIRSGQQQILFVAAAGNGNFIGIGQNNDTSAFYPANYSTLSALGYDSVISVAAITSTGAKASFSNYGMNTVDIGAPGNSIYSTVPGGGYGTKSGTSMAAPHVTGAIALYSAAVGAGVSAEAIKTAILNSAAPTSSLLDKVTSDGRLDIGKLMAMLDQTPPSATGAIVDALDNVGAQTGALASGATTDDTSPQLRGTLTSTLAADEVLNVYRDGVKLGQAVVNGVSWSYQDTAVSNGAHGWTVRAADLAGNQGTASSGFSLTIQGPSIFYGTNGSDTVAGTSGADTIFGVLQSGGDLGRSEVDVLTGGGGADTFVLGDARGRFYDDGRSVNAGTSDYARITDFNSAEGDKLQLAGSAGDYLQHVTTIGGVTGLGIYFDTNNNNVWGTRDELIAFLPGKSSLAAGDFVYV